MNGFIPAGYARLADYAAQSSVEEVGAALAAGSLRSFEMNLIGQLSEIPPETWRSRGSHQMVSDGVFPRPDSRANVTWSNPILVLLPDQPRAARGGRPTKWDWEGAIIELARLDAIEGTENKSAADLAKHLQCWFATTTGDAPADSEIRLRVKRFRDALKT